MNTPLNKETLIARVARGDKFNFIHFWKTENEHGYLSNWWRSWFELEHLKFNCVEQYMMFKKAELFGDKDSAAKILNSGRPYEMKRAGRDVKNFDNTTWVKNREDIVLRGLVAKFKQNPMLMECLLKTDDSILVEASPFDKIWGIGLEWKETDPTKWMGLNLLGFLLMKARDIVKIGESA